MGRLLSEQSGGTDSSRPEESHDWGLLWGAAGQGRDEVGSQVLAYPGGGEALSVESGGGFDEVKEEWREGLI